jgi:hypothetical protein
LPPGTTGPWNDPIRAGQDLSRHGKIPIKSNIARLLAANIAVGNDSATILASASLAVSNYRFVAHGNAGSTV